MKNKVFIVWNNDNLKVAEQLRDILNAKGYKAIIGGQSADNIYVHVGASIIAEMKSCDLAILLIEKVETDDGKITFNDNVMFEWGFLSSHFSKPNQFSVFLIDTKYSELPSDVLGEWCECISREDNNNIADIIAEKFINKQKKIAEKQDKIYYIAKWEENKAHIMSYDPNITNFDVVKTLFFSLKAIDVSNDFDDVIAKISEIKPHFDPSNKSILGFSEEYLKFFKETDRLSKHLSSDKSPYFSSCFRDENEVFNTEDEEFLFWYKFIKDDILSVSYWMSCTGVEGYSIFLREAIDIAEDLLKRCKTRLNDHPEDELFSKYCSSLIMRSLAFMYLDYSEYENKEDNLKKYHDFIKKLPAFRRSLKNKYRDTFSEDNFYYYLLQEFYLSSIEAYQFVDEKRYKLEIKYDIEKFLKDWNARNCRKNAIIKRITEKYKRINPAFELKVNIYTEN